MRRTDQRVLEEGEEDGASRRSGIRFGIEHHEDRR
jgi:hypothetical protein